jgi:hypothetical protein
MLLHSAYNFYCVIVISTRDLHRKAYIAKTWTQTVISNTNSLGSQVLKTYQCIGPSQQVLQPFSPAQNTVHTMSIKHLPLPQASVAWTTVWRKHLVAWFFICKYQGHLSYCCPRYSGLTQKFSSSLGLGKHRKHSKHRRASRLLTVAYLIDDHTF